MELVTEENAKLIQTTLASDAPHPYALAEEPLPLALKAALGVLGPLVLLPLAILRILMLLVLAPSCFLVCLVFGRWRFVIRPLMSLFGRAFLLVFGVWPGLIRIKRPEETRLNPAPILVVAPHVGALEAFTFMFDGMPRPIALEPYTNIPIIGTLFRAANGIAVPLVAANATAKVSPAAGDSTAKPIEKSATRAVRMAIAAHKAAFDPASDTPIGIFPEGAAANGRSVLKFFSGAFEGGGPCQPALLRYPYRYYNAAFFNASLGEHILRLLLTPWQRVELTYLNIYHPSAEESADAALYAENVRGESLRASNLLCGALPCTAHAPSGARSTLPRACWQVRCTMAAAAGLQPSPYGAKELRDELKQEAARSGVNAIGKNGESGGPAAAP